MGTTFHSGRSYSFQTDEPAESKLAGGPFDVRAGHFEPAPLTVGAT